MIRVLDRNDDKVVQKVVTPKGDLIRYQYGIPGNPMTAVSTLIEARVGIGKMGRHVLTANSEGK